MLTSFFSNLGCSAKSNLLTPNILIGMLTFQQIPALKTMRIKWADIDRFGCAVYNQLNHAKPNPRGDLEPRPAETALGVCYTYFNLAPYKPLIGVLCNPLKHMLGKKAPLFCKGTYNYIRSLA